MAHELGLRGQRDRFRVNIADADEFHADYLGERTAGSLATLRGRFNAALGQISEDIPRHTRSWTDASSRTAGTPRASSETSERR